MFSSFSSTSEELSCEGSSTTAELKNPSYVPVISGYIEGIFFCHLTIWVSAIKRNYQEDIA